jgi:GNAT superfamily N-acetyltransferase
MIIRKAHPDELKRTRYKVLWPHLTDASFATLDVDSKKTAIHIAAVNDEGVVVGVASLFVQSPNRYPNKFIGDKIIRLRAMGVLPEMRGDGVGAAIIDFAVEYCKGEGYSTIWCDAREVAFRFYERQEFKYVDENDTYEVKNIGPHKTMYLTFTSES